ncbi:MAG: leucyl aminopeptidase family protein [Alphaproteobacteria bacterium]|nr:leucyl aminopeptidase family protein [Alphaproteobacteria bacterium]
MHSYFIQHETQAVPIFRVEVDNFQEWKKGQTVFIQNWLATYGAKGKVGEVLSIPNPDGFMDKVIYVDQRSSHVWDYAGMVCVLKKLVYVLDDSFSDEQAALVYLSWGLSAYRYDRYTEKDNDFPRVVVRKGVDIQAIQSQIESTNLVRDLINTPANDMGPQELEEAAVDLAKSHKAAIKIIHNEALLEQNYPAVYTVGMASTRFPRLIDIRWGDPKHKKITLVGKGVCFDSGGLDIKPASGMLTMKKDMGGAAHVLGLAKLIMEARLPICLRVLIPAVENSISGQAFRPLDVITMRSGKTVEVGNTDAEGRLILADALHEADSEEPALIIDFATLTGAARIAMGLEVGAMFSNHEDIAEKILKKSVDVYDPLWRMPLWEGYRGSLKSKVADLSSTGSSSYGGAITAALFLSEFLPNKTPWVHLDIMAWNNSSSAGRQEGGEAMGLRALYAFVQDFIKT